VSNVYFISDLHIGHKSILKFRNTSCKTLDEHDRMIIDRWNSVVQKRDTIYLLGDACMDRAKLPLLKELMGNKILIIGNHDKYGIDEYKKYFSDIHGFRTYKGYWISHAPIHPQELRGRKNIHGHLHNEIVRYRNGVPDDRYFSVCVDQLDNYAPIRFDKIKEITGGPEC